MSYFNAMKVQKQKYFTVPCNFNRKYAPRGQGDIQFSVMDDG